MVHNDTTDFNGPVLESKLTAPRQAAELVPRNRLVEQLQAGTPRSLTVICAPAGFGKTTLAAEWIAVSGRKTAWVSLDPSDSIGGQLWRYVIAAVDRAYPGYREDVGAVLPLLSSDDVEQGLVVLLNGLSRLSGELVIVLDDFHVIRNERISQAIAYFTAYLPGNVQLCLLSRSEPGFPVSRLEARQLALRIDAHELRFTEQEGRLFFENAQLSLAPEQVAILLDRTEGWVTGLKLAALTLARLEDREQFIRDFSGDSRQVQSFLFEEVWSQLPERMRRFLVKCSVLKRWNASLCRAVTGFDDSAELIRFLQKSMLFVVSLDNRGRWFRFHHLFSEFLQRQAELDGEAAPSLCMAAGRWCAEERLGEEAVEYYLLGGHYDEAITLLQSMSPTIVQWEWEQMENWLSSIPIETLLEHPTLFFSYVNSLFAENADKVDMAEGLIAEADRWLERAAERMDEQRRRQYLAMSHYVRGMIMVFGYYDLDKAKHHCEQVVHYAPGGIRILFGRPQKPLQASTVRSYKVAPGQSVRSITEPYTFQLAQLFLMVNPVFLGRLYINYAELLYQWNDLDQAESYAREGLGWAAQIPSGAEHDLIPGWVALARVQAAGGNPLEAAATVENGLRIMRERGLVRGQELLELELVRLKTKSGETLPLQHWMKRCRLSAADQLSVYELYEFELYARGLLLQERLSEANELLEKLHSVAEREMRPLDAIEILLLCSCALRRKGEKRKSLQRLEEALRIAESNGFLRIVVDEGEAVRGLLADLIAAKQHGHYRGQHAASLSFVRTVLAAIDHVNAPVGDDYPLASLLTARELDVFQGLQDHLTGKQIAERLHITYETVKTHRSRIYSKLGVRNREEALRRAEQLGAGRADARPGM